MVRVRVRARVGYLVGSTLAWPRLVVPSINMQDAAQAKSCSTREGGRLP